MKKKQIVKKIFFILQFLFCSHFIFSYSGVLSGAKGKLKVFKTTYFDIIFEENCEESAEKIYKVADNYYEEISKKLSLKEKIRFPVTITSQVHLKNAYFSMAPYNHIVLFDSKTLLNDDCYKNEIESTFYHELTHALTLNSKGKFFKGLSVFADFLTPAGLSLTSFWFEGVAVSFESLSEGGRLNDIFFVQNVLETKLQDFRGEKKFPSWRDLTGARDIFPYGNDAYIFGSLFAQYLIQTYGIEKYGEFWKTAGSKIKLSFCAGVFNEVYGNSLSLEWKNFIEKIPVVKIDENQRKIALEKENLISSKNSVIEAADCFFNKKENRYEYVWFDSEKNAVFLNGKKVFSCSLVKKIQFIENGKKIGVFHYFKKDNFKEQYFEYDIAQKKVQIKNIELKNKIEKNHGAKIKKESLNWKIQFEKDDKIFEYDFKDTILHNLHFEKENENFITFVFVYSPLLKNGIFSEKEVNFSRPGKIKINKNTFEAEIFFANKNLPFGIIDFIPFDEKNIYAVTQEFSSNPVRKLFFDWNDCTILKNKGTDIQIYSNYTDKIPSENQKSESAQKIPFQKYEPLKYYAKGAKLPLGIAFQQNHNFENTDNFILGGSFVSGNPWTNGLFYFSAGINPFNFKEFPAAIFSSYSVSDSSKSFLGQSNITFDKNGFFQLNSQIDFSKVFYRTLNFHFLFCFDSNILYGKENDSVTVNVIDQNQNIFKQEFKRKGLSIIFSPGITFSNIKKVDSSFDKTAGVYFKTFLPVVIKNYVLENNDFSFDYEENSINLALNFGFRLPAIIPLQSDFYFFPQNNVFFAGKMNADLFVKEIQKGVPFMSIYLSRFVLSVFYESKILTEKIGNFMIFDSLSILKNISLKDYEDSFGLKAYFKIMPNTSYFASSGANIEVGGKLFYKFNCSTDEKWGLSVLLNVEL